MQGPLDVPAPPPALKIVICGGGNGAHVAAGYLASKQGLQVSVLTRRPQDWHSEIEVLTSRSSWSHRGTIYGRLFKKTSDPAQIVPDADVILIAAPAHVHPAILLNIKPHLAKNVLLGTLFAQGGFDWAVKRHLGHQVLANVDAIFGLQNIPWLCRTLTYGQKAEIIGPKKVLYAAAVPPERVRDVARVLSLLFDIPTTCIPNFLSLTLTPSNQIIHPARYYGIWKAWDGRRPLRREEIQWGLYSEMDEFSALWMQKLDDELQQIKKALEARYPALDLTAVLPLGERVVNQYGQDVTDRSSLKTIFASNKGYAGCITPAKQVEGGYMPAVDSRLFWEDIPYGLCLLRNIAEMLCLTTPSIDWMIRWHQQWMGRAYLPQQANKLNAKLLHETAAPAAYGITSLDQLVYDSLPPSGRHAMDVASAKL
eukprot:GHVT01047960.1.p1 GENE.GHVT01047960.1~~GHVT01047960.1.p1  ORF type:complete len:425 (+),score=60.73 GHVT01047960.1:886-2160(+)